MSKITITAESVNTMSDGFYIENEGLTDLQTIGALSTLVRYLTDNTELDLEDIIELIKSSRIEREEI